ncbi:MAG: hypothetical protein M3444_20280 [Acidobacteriota bacterium]|nr:hypothetical protein [Acidobacteriota bacterium]MDQ5835834.1 hypothetical protein [Acidobacteriota bacterium]
MSNTTTFDPPDAEHADLRAAVDECIAEIDRVRKRMENDQEEIDRLKSETREILARLKAA